MARLINLPKEEVSGVYTIVNTRNGKFYIGSSLNLKERAIVHEREIRRGKHSNKSIQNDLKNDDLLEFKIIKIIDENSCISYLELKEKTRHEEYVYMLEAKQKNVELYNRETIEQIKGRIERTEKQIKRIEQRKIAINNILNYSDEKLLHSYKHEIFDFFEMRIVEDEILKRMDKQ